MFVFTVYMLAFVFELRVSVFEIPCVGFANACTFGFVVHVLALRIHGIRMADVCAARTFRLFAHVAHTHLACTRLTCTHIDRTNIARVARMCNARTPIVS